jgi:hypothetical protein
MGGTPLTWRRLTCIAMLAGCGAGDTRLDPGDLELRDLLGVSSDVASTWDADQRAAARRVLSEGLSTDGPPIDIALADGKTLDERIGRALTASDQQRRAAGDDALGVVRVTLIGDRVHEVGRRADSTLATLDGTSAPQAVSLVVSERWHNDLPGRGLDQLAAIAIDAGHQGGSLEVAPAARVPVIATYIAASGGDSSSPPRLLVNPVFLAVLEPTEVAITDQPGALEAAPSAVEHVRPATAPTTGPKKTPYAGNPYSFYGSVNECAAFQRTRCESCLSNNSCEAVTADTDGATECQTLANSDGRGYYLLCINLALAITSVANCSADKASGCARDVDAANDLGQLENNKNFLEDQACASTLDGCLADIFGAPSDDFPGLIDAGVPALPTTPPRSTNVSCSESCSNDNCEASPSCGSGPSCRNSLSCDGACSSSNDQTGCGGDCNACTSDDSGSGGSSSCGGSDGGGSDNCGGGSSDGDGCGDGGSSCGSGDSSSSCGGDSSSSGGGCGGGSGGGGGCSSDSSSGGGGGGCGGGSSSSSGGGCSGGSGGGGGSSGGSSCSLARRRPSPGATNVV